jgi:hypothetical protein
MSAEDEIRKKHLLLELKKEQLILEDPDKKVDDEFLRLLLGDLTEAVIQLLEDSGVRAELVKTPTGVLGEEHFS